MWRWTANSLGQVRREKCISSFLFTSSIKHEIKYFHVVVLQKRQRNVQKSVMNVQSLSNLLHFWHSPAVDVADRKALIKNIISRKIDPLFASLGDNYGIGFIHREPAAVHGHCISGHFSFCHPSVFDIQPTYQRGYSDLVFTPIPRFWQKVDYFRIKGLFWSSYTVLLFLMGPITAAFLFKPSLAKH